MQSSERREFYLSKSAHKQKETETEQKELKAKNDIGLEKRLRSQQAQQRRMEKQTQIDLHNETIKAQRAAKEEADRLEKEAKQKERENERNGQIKSQVKLLQRREEELMKEIAILERMRERKPRMTSGYRK